MPLLPINDYDNIEFCLTPNNPAVLQARKILNRICVPRAIREDRECEQAINLNQEMPQGKIYHTCQNCLKRGIRTRFLKLTMKEIPRRTKRNGKIVKTKHYLCSHCAENYIPQSQRVGCSTY
jgi:hypothetical protein